MSLEKWHLICDLKEGNEPSHVDNEKSPVQAVREYGQFKGWKGSLCGPGIGAWWGLVGYEDGEGAGLKLTQGPW